MLTTLVVIHNVSHDSRLPATITFPFSGRSLAPHLIRLTYPPLMAGLFLGRVQRDLTFPVPVPIPLSRTISGITMALNPPPRALFFDVFGTCVDWRTTVVRELHAQSHAALNSATASLASAVRLRASEITIEHWGVFAQQWRNSYKQFTRHLAQDPSISWVSVDEHHLRSLQELMVEWQVEGLWDDEQLRQISLVWHRLEPWSDAAMGVALLNRLFCTFATTLVNTDIDSHRYMHSL